jgi:hypothetical protein
LCEPDERRRLALAGLGRGHAGDAHDLGVGCVLQALEDRQRDLGLIATEGLDLVLLKTRAFGDRLDRD